MKGEIVGFLVGIAKLGFLFILDEFLDCASEFVGGLCEVVF